MAAIMGAGKIAFIGLVALIAVSKAGGKIPQPPASKPIVVAVKPCVGQEVKQYALEHGIEPAIVAAVIKVESNWNANAKGKAGELGLMQLMPKTAKQLGVKDRSDPVDNVKGGIRYLAECKKLAGHKYLRCFNGGPGGVNLPATKAYEAKVLAAAKALG